MCIKVGKSVLKAISPQVLFMVLRILSTCVLVSLISWVFLWFKIGCLILVLFFSLVVNFLFFSSYFPVTTLGLDQFLVACLNKLQFLWFPLRTTSQSKGSTRLGASLTQSGNRTSFQIVVLYKIKWSQPPHPKLCQLTSVMLCSLFWISWCWKMGTIGYPQMSVPNYHTTLHNDLAVQALVWIRTVWLRVISYAVWFGTL